MGVIRIGVVYSTTMEMYTEVNITVKVVRVTIVNKKKFENMYKKGNFTDID